MSTNKQIADVCAGTAKLCKEVAAIRLTSAKESEQWGLRELAMRTRAEAEGLTFIIEHLEKMVKVYAPELASTNSDLDPQDPEHDLAKIMPNEV